MGSVQESEVLYVKHKNSYCTPDWERSMFVEADKSAHRTLNIIFGRKAFSLLPQ